MSTAGPLRSLFNILRNKLVTLNLYDSQSSNPEIIRRELRSTRVFLIFLFFSVLTLTLYTSLSVRVKSKTVTRPTQATYERLLKNYSTTLQCPCAHISIPYGTFVNVVPVFHQVCSSDFVSQLWIDFVFETNTTFVWPMDIRTSLSTMCQLISTLCQSARNSLIDTIDQFTNSTLINSMVLSEELLRMQSKAALDSAYRTALSIFERSFFAIRQITQANGFITGLLVNAAAVRSGGNPSKETGPVLTVAASYILPRTTKTCSCLSKGSCLMPGGLYLYQAWETYGIYNLRQIIANKTLPGFVFDCLPLMTTLASSLDCFYNESCLQTLLSAYSKKINVSILDSSIVSRFVPTTTVEQLINELFIEKTLNKTDYASYYSACAPVYCSYTFSRQFDWIYIATILLMLVGGLSTVLRLITPYAIDFIIFLSRRRTAQVVSQTNETIPIAIRVRNVFLNVKHAIIELNLFDDHPRDTVRTSHGRTATRLYVVLLTSTISLMIMYMSMPIQTISETIQSPSQEQYEGLQERYPSTLQCPCRVVSIPYGELIEVMPMYHQLCRSDFVQSWWYESLPSFSMDMVSHLIYSASSHFRILAMFCEIANLTIATVTRRFSLMMFTNAQVMTAELFNSQMNALIDTLLNSTQTEFLDTMSLINTVLQANQYVSVWSTNTVLMQRNFSQLDPFALQPLRIIAVSGMSTEENGKICNCVRNAACKLTDRFDEFIPIEGVPSTGCSIVDIVLDSTLTCWYDNTCFNEVRRLISEFHSNDPILNNLTLLDPILSSRFPPNTSIRMIVNEMMVERWNRSIFYGNFYQNCHPANCSFTYQERIHIVSIITTVIGIFGGLSTILQLLSPVLVQIFFKCIRLIKPNNSSQASDNQETTDHNPRVCLCQCHPSTKLRNIFSKLNLFKSASSDIQIIRRELLSTRLYLLLLLTSISAVIIYTVLSVEITVKKIDKPFQAQYEELKTLHSDSLQCPCEHISVRQGQFITVNPSFHQVCSSDFVKDVWLDYLFGDGRWDNYERSDLRVRGAAYFGLLSTLCMISETTVKNATEQFLTEVFVNAKIMPEFEFLSKMSLITQQFETTTPTRFSCNLRFLRDITHGNAFVSSYFLNWYWWVKSNRSSMTFPTRAVTLDNDCSCGTRSDCTESGGIYRSFSNTQYFAMPGWNVGCSTVETLLRSTFECLYNETCINLLVYYATTVDIAYPLAINVSAMNLALSSRFQSNAMIEDIVDALFVEQWHINVSYSAFYNQCAPTYCSYTFENHNSYLNIASTLLGLYGGLTVSLRFLVPYLIKLAFKIRSCCSRT